MGVELGKKLGKPPYATHGLWGMVWFDAGVYNILSFHRPSIKTEQHLKNMHRRTFI